MSAIRYFDQIPHIVRYGMHSEKDEKCWIWFWRNGVRFKIFVNKEDVQDTPFYDEWKPLLREHPRGEMPLSRWAEIQWHPLCDLIISTSMPTLVRLAPNRSHWTTLRDYVHTPAYQLKLLKSGLGTEIVAHVEEGPIDTGAYELSPVSQDRLPLPNELQHYSSQDLTVLSKDKDWRRKPEKVSTPDGKILFFLGCETDTRDGVTKQINNHSLVAIRAQLKLRESLAGSTVANRPDGIPQVQGVVTDEPDPEGPQNSPDTEITGTRTKIAGILLTWIPQGKTLDQTVPVLAKASEPYLKAKIEAWRSCIERMLEQLHQSGVFLGGRADWSYLNQYTVLMDVGGDCWLNMSHTSLAADVSAKEAEAGMAMDNKAVVGLFEDWLPSEVVKKRVA